MCSTHKHFCLSFGRNEIEKGNNYLFFPYRCVLHTKSVCLSLGINEIEKGNNYLFFPYRCVLHTNTFVFPWEEMK